MYITVYKYTEKILYITVYKYTEKIKNTKKILHVTVTRFYDGLTSLQNYKVDFGFTNR